MKKKNLFSLLILFFIITISLIYSKCSFANSLNRTLITNSEQGMTEGSSNIINSNEIIYMSDKSMDLDEGDIINLELSLKDNKLNTPHSLTICLMKVEANMNKDGIIGLLGSQDDLNTYSEALSYKTLDIENISTTSFDVKGSGKYIIFVLDKENIINPSNLEVKCEFTINGNDYEIDENDSSVLEL